LLINEGKCELNIDIGQKTTKVLFDFSNNGKGG
jgi:hypothetical protein